MKLIKLSFLGFFVSLFSVSNTFADTLVFQCKMKNGKINFTDEPCKNNQKDIGHKTIKPISMTHSTIPQSIPDSPTVVYHRYEEKKSFDQIAAEKEAQRQREWDNAGRVGVTPYNSPGTWFNTHYAQH